MASGLHASETQPDEPNWKSKMAQYLRHSAQTYLQLPVRQWGAGKVYLLVLSNWKVNIAENPIAVMGL